MQRNAPERMENIAGATNGIVLSNYTNATTVSMNRVIMETE